MSECVGTSFHSAVSTQHNMKRNRRRVTRKKGERSAAQIRLCIQKVTESMSESSGDREVQRKEGKMGKPVCKRVIKQRFGRVERQRLIEEQWIDWRQVSFAPHSLCCDVMCEQRFALWNTSADSLYSILLFWIPIKNIFIEQTAATHSQDRCVESVSLPIIRLHNTHTHTRRAHCRNSCCCFMYTSLCIRGTCV